LGGEVAARLGLASDERDEEVGAAAARGEATP